MFGVDGGYLRVRVFEELPELQVVPLRASARAEPHQDVCGGRARHGGHRLYGLRGRDGLGLRGRRFSGRKLGKLLVGGVAGWREKLVDLRRGAATAAEPQPQPAEPGTAEPTPARNLELDERELDFDEFLRLWWDCGGRDNYSANIQKAGGAADGALDEYEARYFDLLFEFIDEDNSGLVSRPKPCPTPFGQTNQRPCAGAG